MSLSCEPVTRLYLVRHAQAEGNLYRRAHGWYDSRLTPEGMAQVAALTERFRDIPVDVVYASDLNRTCTTAQAVYVPKGLPLLTDPGLREINLGSWGDKPWGELLYFAPEDLRRFFTADPTWQVPGSETFQQTADRVTRTFFRLAKAHPGKTVALFSHAVAIRCFQAALRGMHPSQRLSTGPVANTAVSCYEVRGDEFRILFENDASHLPPELTTVLSRSNVPVWFRPLDMERDAAFYYEARKDAWLGLYGSLSGFDGPGFLRDARDQGRREKRGLWQVMWEEKPMGVLHLATLQDAGDKIGHIPFLWLAPDYRGQGLGFQLVGQAVSVYRSMGRNRLRLQCSPRNEAAQGLYAKCGFEKAGQVPGARGPLDLLEMPI